MENLIQQSNLPTAFDGRAVVMSMARAYDVTAEEERLLPLPRFWASAWNAVNNTYVYYRKCNQIQIGVLRWSVLHNDVGIVYRQA